MQALKDAKKLVGKSHVEADTIVTDVDRRSLRKHAGANLYPRLRPSPGELDGVAQQIRKDLPYERWIAFDRRQWLQLPLNLATHETFAELFNQGLEERAKRNR